MDKHYGWQEGRGSQGQGRPQNGQRWNERYRDDDRDVRGSRGGEFGGGSEPDDRRWASSGADLDREDYLSEDEEYGTRSRRGFGSRGQSRWSQPSGGSYRGQSTGQFEGNQFRGEGYRGNQGYGNQSYGNQGYGGSQGFSGGHYGGFANEGYPGQGNYGGNRGFSNQGYSGQRFGQSPSSQGRQTGQNWGQTFGQGYSGSEPNQGFSGTQGSRSSYQGRGFAGRGPKGYTRSDDRIKEQVSDRLMDDDDIDASEISIEVKNGEVTLSGTVSSRDEKRAAEDAAEQTPGVREVLNQLRVSPETSPGQFGQTGQSGRTGQQTTGQSKSRNTERE